ncbi:membrane protein [Defluviimonas sp. 20V17]|uniref:Membrane protein n=1 Tax=Allgaiera indica TaxID=765699 RepID=A0AAN4UPN6_9RHOB|nr:membrane protein [Defluviimonas sp. 20V17]GHD99878.1 membrane protein [Allgaiera indica]SDW41468.1 EamA domain-containing membrane protein RarD [Allgaiera indica]
MLAFCATATLADALAKVLGGQVALFHLITLRFAFQAVILLPILWAGGGSLRMRPRVVVLNALRTVLQVGGIGAMYTALRFLPLANAIAIAYVEPFLMLLLSHFFLREEVGPRRLLACVAGFAGTLLVIKPSFAEAGPAALLPLAVAVIFALYMMLTRQISREADALRLQAASGVMASLVLIPLALVAPFGLPAPGVMLAAPQPWALLVALGVTGTFAHLFMTWSLRHAPAATVAPVQYMEIPFATLTGYLVFADFPDRLALVGIALTVASGLYIVWRERMALAQPA